MALTWKWDEKVGEAVVRQSVNGEDREFTLNLYNGNALLIFMYEYKENGTDKYNLWSFWCDAQHMKNCLGLKKGTTNIYNSYDRLVKIRLNKKKCRGYKEIVAALASADFDNFTIELYTEKEENR